MNAPAVLLDRSCCMFERTGTFRYVENLQQGLLQAGCPLVPFQPYPDQALAAGQPRRHARILLADFWHSRHLPRRTARGRGEVIVHHPVLPTRSSGLCNVITVHDLNVLHELGSFSRYNRLLARRRLAQLDQADGVIAISDFVKNDLLQHSPHLAGRITTVHHGLHMQVRRIPQARKTRGRILFVGGIGPNKNLLHAVQAIALLRQQTGLPVEFRIVGPVIRPRYAAQLERLIAELQLGGCVQLAGPVDEPALVREYSEAAVVFFYSTREGFGFPVLEAQAHGCAVVCSRATSLPEIGGDGCRYADPGDPRDAAAQLADLLRHDDQAADLVERGYRNVANYTWNACAENTMRAYESAWRRWKDRRP